MAIAAGHGGQTAAAEPIEMIDRVDRRGELALSFNQEARLYLEMWSQRCRAFQHPMHLTVGLRVEGLLNPETLAAALNGVVSRHEALRTTFAVPHGAAPASAGDRRSRMPALAIEANAVLPLATESVEGLDADDQWRHVEHAAAEDYEAPFDYSRPPLMRARLIRLQPASHVLVLTLHHLIGDAWSCQILRRDLGTLYGSIEAGQSDQTPPLRVHYVDFAHWQRRRRQSGAFDAAMAYWSRRWSDCGSSLVTVRDLPFARNHAPGEPSPTSSETLSIDGSLREQLRLYAKNQRATLHVVCLAAFTILLHLYTKKPRVTVWGQFANRLHIDFEHVVGWFANPHILAVDLSDDPTATHVVERVRRVAIEAFDRQELPLSLLMPTFMQQRRDDGAGHAAFDKSAVQFDFADQRPSRLGDATMTPIVLSPGTRELGLQVSAADHGRDMALRARYFSNDFSRTDIRSMLHDLHAVLQIFVTNPHATLAGLAVRVSAAR